MTTITIELSNERVRRLKEYAKQFGIPMEELVRASLEDMLAQPDEQFQKSMQYVLRKNAELYKRLAA